MVKIFALNGYFKIHVVLHLMFPGPKTVINITHEHLICMICIM